MKRPTKEQCKEWGLKPITDVNGEIIKKRALLTWQRLYYNPNTPMHDQNKWNEAWGRIFHNDYTLFDKYYNEQGELRSEKKPYNPKLTGWEQ